MKKWILVCLCLIIFSLIVFAACLIHQMGINPFLDIGREIEKDFINNYDIFMQVVLDNTEDILITKENYDKSSEELCKIFEALDYEFIRISYDTVFFCKGYDGMTGTGLLYSNYSYTPNPKQKVVKQLKEKWVILEEHVL